MSLAARGESLFSARPKTVDMSRGKGAIRSVVWLLSGYMREAHLGRNLGGIKMPNSKPVELRSSQEKRKRSKLEVVLRRWLIVVRLLTLLFKAADKLWIIISGLFS